MGVLDHHNLVQWFRSMRSPRNPGMSISVATKSNQGPIYIHTQLKHIYLRLKLRSITYRLRIHSYAYISMIYTTPTPTPSLWAKGSVCWVKNSHRLAPWEVQSQAPKGEACRGDVPGATAHHIWGHGFGVQRAGGATRGDAPHREPDKPHLASLQYSTSSEFSAGEARLTTLCGHTGLSVQQAGKKVKCTGPQSVHFALSPAQSGWWSRRTPAVPGNRAKTT